MENYERLSLNHFIWPSVLYMAQIILYSAVTETEERGPKQNNGGAQCPRPRFIGWWGRPS